MTTHHLEEAETLASNIIFLSSGTVKLEGTVEDLKHTFGLGFTVELISEKPHFIDYFWNLKQQIETEIKTKIGNSFCFE